MEDGVKKMKTRLVGTFGCLRMFLRFENTHPRGERLIAQGLLPFKYELESSEAGMTGLGGLPLYWDLAAVMGLSKSIEQHVGVRVGEQGWTDVPVVMALILMNLAGGEQVEDWRRLEEDEGFCRVLRKVERAGLKRKRRRAWERRWRKERQGTVPSGYEQLRGFERALSLLPEGVKKVRRRSDTAAYQQELLRYGAAGKHPRLGRIEFALSCDGTREFKEAVAEVPKSEGPPLYRE